MCRCCRGEVADGVHLFGHYFLSIYGLGTGNMAGNKTNKNACPLGVHSLIKDTLSKTATSYNVAEGSKCYGES